MYQEGSKHVYIIGRKPVVQKCLETLTGEEHDLFDMTTDIEDVRLGTDELSLDNLKDHHMECENSLDLNGQTYPSKHNITSISHSSPKMKRLKSFDNTSELTSSRNYAHFDIGYESDTTESEEGKGMRASICAIIVEDDTRLNNRLASFVFTTLEWPALILLPIDSEIFNIDLYVDFIKELGMHATGNKNTSKLMVVGLSSQSTEVQEHRNRLECDLFDSYFGNNFDFCKLDNLLSKVKEFLNRKCTEPSSSQSVELENDKHMITSHELVNRFHHILIEMHKKPSFGCTINIYDFIKLINPTSGKRLFVDALVNLNLIHEQGHKRDKYVTLMPFICTEIIPEFEKVEYVFDTNPLKMEFNLDIIPPYLRAKIFKTLLTNGWSVKSSGPESCKEDSVLFLKESHRILIHFKSSDRNTSLMCVYGLRTRESTENLPSKEYNELRESIDSALNICKRGGTNKNDVVKYYVKLKDDQAVETIIKEDKEQWLEVSLRNVDQKIASNMTKYLSPWFSSEIANVEKELNIKMSDSVLSDISSLFAQGYFMFFVSEGIPHACLQRINLQNQNSIEDAVLKMLQEWRKMKGTGANLAVLRSALKESSHIIINFHEFDEIVKRHNGQPKH